MMFPARFVPNVEMRGPAECWLWTARVSQNGQPSASGGSVRRMVWRATSDVELTKDDWVTVLCGNALCLNPAHLGLRSLRIEDQFWGRVNKLGPNGCWVWTGATYRRGYGRFHHRCKMYRAHRYSYEIHHGPIPTDGPEMCVLHRCDNPPCVNPAHLFLGTDADNQADMDRKGRRSKGDIHGDRVRLGRELRARGLVRKPLPIRKLTDEEVRQIRAEVASGGLMRVAGERFGVSRTTVWDIVKGPRSLRCASQEGEPK